MNKGVSGTVKRSPLLRNALGCYPQRMLREHVGIDAMPPLRRP
jgi:hypothetical protein